MQTSPGSCWVCHAQRSRDEANTNNVNFFFNLKKQAKKKRQKTNKISTDKKKIEETEKNLVTLFLVTPLPAARFTTAFGVCFKTSPIAKRFRFAWKWTYSFPRKFALIQRQRATRKWPITIVWCPVSRSIQSMESIIDDNRYQSIPIRYQLIDWYW